MNKFITFLIMCVAALAFTTQASAESYDLPPQDTNIYTYMDYKCITNRSSEQWKLQQDEHTYTTQSGLRAYKDDEGNCYFLVALAELYGEEIGTTYKVTLDNGSEFLIMLGDCKGDTPTIYGHSCYNFLTKKNCTNVIEFIVDDSELPSKVKSWGSLSAFEFFNGNIQAIEQIG